MKGGGDEVGWGWDEGLKDQGKETFMTNRQKAYTKSASGAYILLWKTKSLTKYKIRAENLQEQQFQSRGFWDIPTVGRE